MDAIEFATKAHEGQIRKYTGEPYINHPKEVDELFSLMLTGCTPCEIAALTQGMKSPTLSLESAHRAAWLHDVIEDCGVTEHDLLGLFDEDTVTLVKGLSDDKENPLKLNRATRKEVSRNRLRKSSLMTRFLKVADLIHNMRSIMIYDKDFGTIFLSELEIIRADELFMSGMPSVAAVLLDTHIIFAQLIIKAYHKDKRK